MRRAAHTGFTLVELLVALVLMMILITAFSVTMIANMRVNASTKQRTAGLQVLPAVAAQIEQNLDTVAKGTTKIFMYQVGDGVQALSAPTVTSCSDYLNGISEGNIVCGEVTNSEDFNPGSLLGTTSARTYDIKICWKDLGKVKCSAAKTISS